MPAGTIAGGGAFGMSVQYHTTDSDVSLVEGCVRGDSQAWSALVDKYGGYVHCAIRRKLATSNERHLSEDANDIFQSVFHTLLKDDCRALRQLRHRERIAGWLGAIAVNRTLDFLRSRTAEQRGQARLREQPGLYTTSRHDDPARRDMHRKLRDALEQLPHEERLVLKLYYLHGEKYREIAEITSSPINTVSSRLHRAKQRFREILDREGLLDDVESKED